MHSEFHPTHYGQITKKKQAKEICLYFPELANNGAAHRPAIDIDVQTSHLLQSAPARRT